MWERLARRHSNESCRQAAALAPTAGVQEINVRCPSCQNSFNKKGDVKCINDAIFQNIYWKKKKKKENLPRSACFAFFILTLEIKYPL